MTGPNLNPLQSVPAGAWEGRAPAFARHWSMEATRPSATDINAIAEILPRGTPVYLSAVPTQSHDEHVEAAARLRAAGLEPVPHVAARRHGDRKSFEEFIRRHAEEAGVRRVLVIAGDIDRPAGAFVSALDAIESGVLQGNGIAEIGIAGYPEGHPGITPDELAKALDRKFDAAARAGLRLNIVTQFCFDPQQIIQWIVWLRGRGIDVPVKVGLVGPTSLPTLLNYARRCGVKASARGLLQRPGLLGSLVGEHGPQPIIEALLKAPQDIGEVSPHFFSFGGVTKTAQFGQVAAQSEFTFSP